jgi:hypothetical protein
MTMQKDKGKAYENKIAAYIHDALYKHVKEYKDLFDSLGNINLKPRREKSSGTTKHADNDIDMGLALKFFPFSVECKHNAIVNKITISSICKNDVSFLYKTMEQAKRHAESRNLKPIVFFRGNNTCDMIMISSQDIDGFNAKIPMVFLDPYIIVSAENFMKEYLNYE